MAYEEMTVNIEPEAWQIIDGKLYITAGARFGEDMKAIAPKAEEELAGRRSAPQPVALGFDREIPQPVGQHIDVALAGV